MKLRHFVYLSPTITTPVCNLVIQNELQEKNTARIAGLSLQLTFADTVINFDK